MVEDENIEIDIIEPKNVILKWESESQSLLIFSVRPIPSEMMKTMCFIRTLSVLQKFLIGMCSPSSDHLLRALRS